MERGARGRGAGTERGARVIAIGLSAERVYSSIQYCVYGVVFLIYGTLGHFGFIVRRIYLGALSVCVQ